jgi:hypothetical protein
MSWDLVEKIAKIDNRQEGLEGEKIAFDLILDRLEKNGLKRIEIEPIAYSYSEKIHRVIYN